MKKVEIGRDVREENLQKAQRLREVFDKAGVRAVGLLGSPGSGKTTLLENILPRLASGKQVAVIEGDVATDNDTRRIRATGVEAVQINTGGACHLDTSMVERALEGLDLNRCELLLIENVGNLVCPVSFPVGESLRLAVISAAEGEDKPLKYPSAILRTDAVVITKTDLAPLVHVDPVRMAQYARQINPDVRVFFAGFDPQGEYVCRGEDGAQSLEEYLLG